MLGTRRLRRPFRLRHQNIRRSLSGPGPNAVRLDLSFLPGPVLLDPVRDKDNPMCPSLMANHVHWTGFRSKHVNGILLSEESSNGIQQLRPAFESSESIEDLLKKFLRLV